MAQTHRAIFPREFPCRCQSPRTSVVWFPAPRRVLTPPYFAKEKREGWPIPVLNWLPLEDDPELKVKSKILKKFEKLVEKYYQILYKV